MNEDAARFISDFADPPHIVVMNAVQQASDSAQDVRQLLRIVLLQAQSDRRSGTSWAVHH